MGSRRARWIGVGLLLLALAASAALVSWIVLTLVSDEHGPSRFEPAPPQLLDEAADDAQPPIERPAPPPRPRVDTPVRRRVERAPEPPAPPVVLGSPSPPGTRFLVDSASRPVVGAEVVAIGRDGAEVARVRSDAAGVVLLPDEATTGVRLEITAPGYRPQTAAGGVTDTPTVVLTGTGVLRGQALAPDGRGVPDAVVTARVPQPIAGATAAWTVRTDPDGAFELTGLPSGPFVVVAERPAGTHGDALRAEIGEVPIPTEDLVVELGVWRRVVGTVRDSKGDPIAGAAIAIRARQPDGSGGRVWHANADADGAFAIEDVLPGNTVWVWSAHHPELAMAVVTDTDPGAAPLDVRLVPGGPIEAQLVDAEGKPYTGQATFFVLTDSGHVHNSANRKGPEIKTHVLPFDRYFDLLVYGAGGLSGRIEAAQPGAAGLVIRLLPVAPMTGAVTGPDGAPVPAAIVRARAEGSDAVHREGLTPQTRTDEHGAFAIPDIADVPYALWVDPQDLPDGLAPGPTLRGVRGGHDARLQVTEAVMAHGSVAPAREGVAIWLVPEDGSPWHVECLTDAEGTFRASSTPAGAYALWVGMPNGDMRQLASVRAPFENLILAAP